MQYLPIIVAGLIPMALGFVWYHKAVFGQAWMDSLGFTEKDLASGNMGLTMGLAALLSMMLSLAIKGTFFGVHGGEAALIEAGDLNFGHGAFHGLLIGGMIGIPVLVTNGLFEKKTMKNLLINAAYWLVAISLMNGLLAAWHIPA
ncbi:MAG: DUF1761 domain-containing protein [Saprospiraceae bacterium]